MKHLLHPQHLCTTTPCSNVLSLSSRMGDGILLFTMLGNQIIPKVKTPPGCTFPIISTPCPVSIRKTSNFSCSISRKPNPIPQCPINIFDVAFDRKKVRLFRTGLVTGTNTDIEGNIRTTGYKLQKTPYHTPIKGRIYINSGGVFGEVKTGAHRSTCMFGRLETKL